MIFVCSMTDLFGEWVTDDMLDRIFAVMALCPQHTFQVLTKRPERMRDYFLRIPDRWAGVGRNPTWSSPLPNVWLGVSVEDQRRADERIPELLRTPAAVRWISAEPLLGSINVSWWLTKGIDLLTRQPGPRVNWVVVGGESGPGARPFDIQWAREIIRASMNAGVPVFMKQLGSHPYNSAAYPLKSIIMRDRKGGDPEEWPEDLRIREYPR